MNESKILTGMRQAVAYAKGEQAVAYAKGENVSVRKTTINTPPDVNVRGIREKLGLTQEQFAQTFGVSASTIRNWEQEIRRPEGPARVLLNVIAKEPDAVMRALQ